VLGTVRDAKSIGYNRTFTGNYWVTDENAAAGRSLYDGIKANPQLLVDQLGGLRRLFRQAQKYGHGDVKTPPRWRCTDRSPRRSGPAERRAMPTSAGLTPAIEAIVNYNNGVTMALFVRQGRAHRRGRHVADPVLQLRQHLEGIGDARAIF